MSSSNTISDPDDWRSEDPLATHTPIRSNTSGTTIRSGTTNKPNQHLKKSHLSDPSSSILFGPGAPGAANAGSSSASTRRAVRRKEATNRNKGASLVPVLIFLIGLAACLGVWSSVRHVNRVAFPYTSNTVESELLKQFFNPPLMMNNLGSPNDERGKGFLAVPVDETIGGHLNKKAAPTSGAKKVSINNLPQRIEVEQEQQHANTRGVALSAAAEKGADPGAHYPQLHCEAYGGPTEEVAQEMVYWQEIPSDSHYVSPFHPNNNKDRPKQYMTFEPDGGGWNNIRMAMETVVGLAIATGRILVLPPEQRMYLLAKDHGKIKTNFGFKDFFPFEELTRDNDGLTTVTMQEFLESEWGNMKNKETGEIEYPPFNRTNWDGEDVKLLKEWLRNVTHTPRWAPQSCMAVFPASGEHKDTEQLQSMHKQIIQQGMLRDEYIDNPVPVDASTMDRMREHLAQRSNLCLYDEDMQSQFVVHFMCYHKLGVRLLTHFYAFLFFEDWRDDLWMKRFMRDHMRYIDELQCAAARVVEATRKRALERDPSSNGEFDAFHIRRGDFQYKKTRIDATEIYRNVKDKMQEGATVYIATDERDKKFFNPLQKHFNVLFLDDFQAELDGVNKNYFGMIDQLVASRGRLFFGCWHSTFTGFIMRMRGYHSVKDRLPGYEKGLLPNTFYYVPVAALERMHRFAPLQGAFFNREFPTSWRDIDVGVGKLPHVMNH